MSQGELAWIESALQVFRHASRMGKWLRMAVFDKRTALACFGEHGWRSGAQVEKEMHTSCKRFGAGAQFGCEFDGLAPSRPTIVNGTRGDETPQHLFETQGLSAKLNVVSLTSGLVAATFVFDGKCRPEAPMAMQPDAGSGWLELHDIGLTSESKA